jgi:hypothetical protein
MFKNKLSFHVNIFAHKMSEVDAPEKGEGMSVIEAFAEIYAWSEKEGLQNMKPWHEVVADLEEKHRNGGRDPYQKL